jgi:hypothetical protein
MEIIHVDKIKNVIDKTPISQAKGGGGNIVDICFSNHGARL